MPLCPQCALPQAVAGNESLRKGCYIFAIVVGLSLTFSGAIVQIVGGGTAFHVPPSTVCKSFGFNDYDCTSTEQLYSIAPHQPQSLNTGNENPFKVPCCKGNNEGDDGYYWASNSGAKQYSNFVFSYGDAFNSIKNYFENAEELAGNNPTRFGGRLLGNDQKKLTTQMYKDERATLAHAFAMQNYFPVKQSILNEMSLILGPIFSIILCVSSLLNFTCFTRKGFALVNLALAAAAVAMVQISFSTTVSDASYLFKDVTQCDPFSDVFFNRGAYVGGSSTTTINGLTITLPGPGGFGTSLNGATEPNPLYCVDYKCKPNNGGSATASDLCKKDTDPFYGHLATHIGLTVSGQWVQYVGLLFLVMVLANMDGMGESEFDSNF